MKTPDANARTRPMILYDVGFSSFGAVVSVVFALAYNSCALYRTCPAVSMTAMAAQVRRARLVLAVLIVRSDIVRGPIDDGEVGRDLCVEMVIEYLIATP